MIVDCRLLIEDEVLQIVKSSINNQKSAIGDRS